MLNPDLARRVANLASRVEALFGMPQDVEWAVGNGDLLLLQARPMTALPQPPEIVVPAEGYWQKDDWHYPTPMTGRPGAYGSCECHHGRRRLRVRPASCRTGSRRAAHGIASGIDIDPSRGAEHCLVCEERLLPTANRRQ